PPAPVIPPAAPPVVAPAPVGEQFGPAPLAALARVDANGRLVVRQPVQYYAPVTKYARIDGEEGVTPITRYETRTSLRTERYDLSRVRASRADGRWLNAEQLRGMLKEEAAVLVAADGREVNPFYLKVVKGETVVLRLPVSPLTPPGPPAVVP